MLTPPSPANETERLLALQALNLLDTPAEERFDRLTRIAQYVLQVPIMLVSLVDAQRQWFKSRQGLQASQTPRDISFCGHAILEPDIFVVPDASMDTRFADNPLVTGTPHIRFYAGAPLTLKNGLRVGTLCAIDHQPRQLNAAQLAVLQDLAQCVSEELQRYDLEDVSLIKARYAAIVESSDDAIISKSIDGIITGWNPAAQRLLGYAAQEAIGQPVSMLMPAPRSNEEADILNHLQCGERVAAFETVRLAKNGQLVPVWASMSPIMDSSGKMAGASTTLRDGNVRKDTESALIKSNQLVQSIVETVVDGIITIDSGGLIQSFNKAAEGLFGYSFSEVKGHNVKCLMPEPYAGEHDGYLTRFRQTREPRVIGIGREVVGRRKDGSTFPMELAVSEMPQPEQTLFVGIVRDITERKRTDQMKSEFVSTVSHELRTPLTSISGSLGLLVGGALGEMPALAMPMLDIAYKNSLRLTHLINDLLDMEKLLAGKMRFDLDVQPLMPLIEQALESTHSYAESHQVKLVMGQRADDAMVRVDGGRLVQVLSNFLSNASKFSPAEGQVEIDVLSGDNTVMVKVSDHGNGIPAAFKSRIFEKFSQADGSDTRQKGGTGLGLAISKELIERMNGLIGFESEEGQGAQFYFQLPMSKANPDQTDHNATRDETNTKRLLVVEDDPDIARMLSLMLSRSGYQVDIAADGRTALNMLSQTTYAAITLDIMLPDHSGVVLIREIRGNAQMKLPIVVVSAYTEDARLAINDDFEDIAWLDKPVDAARLIATIERCLASANT